MKKHATLKELCYEYSEDDLDVDSIDQHAADCLVRIFDFYAIEFAEWLSDNAHNDDSKFAWRLYDTKDEEYTIEELLKIYKKEKNL